MPQITRLVGSPSSLAPSPCRARADVNWAFLRAADSRHTAACTDLAISPDTAFSSNSVSTTPPPVPSWLHSSGGLISLCCACLAGMLPFFGIACINLLPGDAPSPPPVQPVVSSPQPPAFVIPPVSNAVSEPALVNAIAGLQQDLRQQLHQQEQVRRDSEKLMSERMRRLEESAVTSSNVANSAPAVVSRSPVIDKADDATAGLGIDLAAWNAGAEIDHQHTTQGLGRHVVGRLSRAYAALAPRWRSAIGDVSLPPEVILAADGAPPSRCFTLPGNGTVAIRFSRAARLTHVVVEQPPQWATTQPKAAPRFFEVWASPANSGAEPYSTSLGSFEYSLQGPRAQAFPVAAESGAGMVALKFVFTGNWGDAVTSICRLRVMGPAMDSL